MPRSPADIARVAVAAPLPHLLSYRILPEEAERIAPGVRVLVPLGKRTVPGIVVSIETGDAGELKPLAATGEEPLFPAAMLPFLLRCADYYRHPPGEALRSVLPAGLGAREVRSAPRSERIFTATNRPDLPRGPKQQAILHCLRTEGSLGIGELRARLDAPAPILRRLVDEGWLSESADERVRDPFAAVTVAADTPPELNPEQQTAREALQQALQAQTFAPFLLHGVTGSGKTEVYLHAIADALALGRTALVLVPEIALTPQLVSRFRARFGTGQSRIAVLHSGLSDGERYDAWRMINRGEAQIVIGARSALFAPLENPGIIVVDEEHDPSYKQGEGFRYHARDLALLRGQMCNSVVLLGSATPAVTTYQRALDGHYRLLTLSARVAGRPLPDVEIIDRRKEAGAATLSPQLAAAIAAELEKKGQVMLLLNRRGYSPALLCHDCGTGFRCPNCDIALTYHAGRRRLVCHYCDYTDAVPQLCPSCRGRELQPVGAGTERLESELAEHFPTARIGRMDRDTTGRKGAHQKIVDAMQDGSLDILVGTQMIAKGHDFPNVTLVGVINADLALNLPDFRAAERAFSLFAQVAGRAGRGERPGRVLIQSRAPEHYALLCAGRHDFTGFFADEIVFRRELGYPPYGHLVNLVLSGNVAETVQAAAETVADELRRLAGSVDILGPAPCPLARLRGRHRVQILLKSPTRPPLRPLLDALTGARRRLPAGISLSLDVDPLDML